MGPPITRGRGSSSGNGQQQPRRDESADSSNFELFVRQTLTEIKQTTFTLQDKMNNFETLIEFESQRTSKIEEKTIVMETKVRELDKMIKKHDATLVKMADAENKLERFSRRNNIRVVGLKEKTGEKPEEVVKKLFRDKFNMEHCKVERAHRDGKIMDGDRPRHMLVKLLSFQEKLEILRGQRKALEEYAIYIVDDLTKKDLEEKRKFKEVVKSAYDRGTRYHFSAGKWRGRNGQLAPFYNQRTAVAVDQDDDDARGSQADQTNNPHAITKED